MICYAFDEDAVNTLLAEDKVYRRWEREQKNRLLAMTNWKRKQELWREMFGVVQDPDDSYLLGEVF